MSCVAQMSVDVGRGLTLRNPILTASGTFGYGLEFEPYLQLDRLGGIVVKGISPKPRAGNAPARIVETPSGMINAIGLQNVGVQRFVDEKLPTLRTRDCAVVVNVYGYSVADYVEVVRTLEPHDGIAAFELNLSCPNVDEGGLEIGRSPAAIAKVTGAVRAQTDRPVWVKLTPNVTDIRETARASVDGGADAVSLVNTFVGMVIDIEKRRPVISHGTGGLSGPAIRPLAVAMVYQVAQAVKVPIIGIGGIVAVRDVVEFLQAGATAVQIGTANYNDPAVASKLVDGLEGWLRDHDLDDVRKLIGVALP